jgi:hypothetical protein
VKTMGSRITRLTPMQGVLRGNGRRAHAVCRHGARHSRLDNPYHHRGDRGRGARPARLGCALEMSPAIVVTAWVLTLPRPPRSPPLPTPVVGFSPEIAGSSIAACLCICPPRHVHFLAALRLLPPSPAAPPTDQRHRGIG